MNKNFLFTSRHNTYKTIEKPLISGDKISVLFRWNRNHYQRLWKKLSFVKFKIRWFCCIPSHLNYEKNNRRVL